MPGIPKQWIIDDSTKNFEDPDHDERLEDGTIVGVKVINGEKRYLSRVITPSGRKMLAAAPSYSSAFPVFPKSDWSEMIKEKKARKARIINYQNFKAHDQNGLPTCWANGPAHAFTTKRVILGMIYREMSACSVAVPISGGHVGGDEWDAGQYSVQHGFAPVDKWSNNDTSRSLNSQNEVSESRLHYKALTIYRLDTDEEHMSASLMDPPLPSAIAFNRWSHVISGADGEEIEPGHFGMTDRNNWGESYGFKNEYGYGGYVTFAFGGWSPSSGFCYGPIVSSL